jgi:hypothetical protein
MVSAFGAYQQMKARQSIAQFNANSERDAGYQNELMYRDQAQFDLARQAAYVEVEPGRTKVPAAGEGEPSGAPGGGTARLRC